MRHETAKETEAGPGARRSSKPKARADAAAGDGTLGAVLASNAGAVALLAALALYLPDEARAQTSPPVCTPTQTVSAAPDANGRYTTTLSCPDTSAAAGEADYQYMHYNQHDIGVRDRDNVRRTQSSDRDATIPNNNDDNRMMMTIGDGVVFTTPGYMDMRDIWISSAISIQDFTEMTVVIEDGAVINFVQTPEYWCDSADIGCTGESRTAAEAVRDAGTAQYDWYPDNLSALERTSAVHLNARTFFEAGDVTVRHDGIINLDIDLRGSYSNYHSSGHAIRIESQDFDNRGCCESDRHESNLLLEIGPSGVIRQVEGSDGINAIYMRKYGTEDGDITANLAAGSLVDVSTSGGYGMLATISPNSYTNRGLENQGQRSGQAGDIIINAGGTIRAAVKHRRTISNLQGAGIVAWHYSNGRIRITSSGTIETWQGNAIYAWVGYASNPYRDDPATAEIEGHLIDVTGGKVHTRGQGAIRAISGSPDTAFTVRVGEGALVRAERDPGPDAISEEELLSNNHGTRFNGEWRPLSTAREPVVNAIRLRGAATRTEGVTDRVLVDGTVETIGGKEDVDPAIYMQTGGVVMVGATGRVSAGSGLAIASGNAPPDELPEGYEPTESDLSVTVAGTVVGDVKTLDDGDLTATVSGTIDGDVRAMGAGALTLAVMEGGAVTGTVHDPAGPLTVHGSIGRLLYTSGGTVTVARTGRLTGVEGEGRSEAVRSQAGDLTLNVAAMGSVTGDVRGLGDGDLSATVAGTLTGDLVEEGAGDLTATVSGTVDGDVRAMGAGALTLAVPEGGVVTGTVHDPASPLTVHGSIGRLLYANGGTVTVAGTGRLTGVEGESEAIRSEAGDLSVNVAARGRVTGDVRGLGDGDLSAMVAGMLTGDLVEEGAGDLTATVSGTVDGDVRATGAGALTLSVPEGGAVTGTVHDPAGPLTVHGSIGRLLYANGGTVTVSGTGRLTGVEVEGRSEAVAARPAT